MLYRIFTEDKNQAEVERIVSQRFPGFTIYKAQGFWRLVKEGTLVIEITDASITRADVNEVAENIKRANAQESVLIQEIQNESWLI